MAIQVYVDESGRVRYECDSAEEALSLGQKLALSREQAGASPSRAQPTRTRSAPGASATPDHSTGQGVFDFPGFWEKLNPRARALVRALALHPAGVKTEELVEMLKAPNAWGFGSTIAAVQTMAEAFDWEKGRRTIVTQRFKEGKKNKSMYQLAPEILLEVKSLKD